MVRAEHWLAGESVLGFFRLIKVTWNIVYGSAVVFNVIKRDQAATIEATLGTTQGVNTKITIDNQNKQGQK